MRISTRVSLFYSLISSLVLIIFGATVYLMSSSHAEFEFRETLKKRVIITENFFLEKESFSEKEFEKIREQFLHALPQETEEVIKLDPDTKPIFVESYTEALKQNLLNNNTYSFEKGEFLGESKKFKIDSKNYLIVVTAVDEVGNLNLSFLFWRIITLILIGIPILLMLSFFIVKRALRPLSTKIKHANSISASNLDQRLKIFNPNDEIGLMAIAFNKLLDRLEQAFDAQKEFISNASHEIKNPLTAVMGAAEITLSNKRTEEEYIDSLKVILAESERLNFTVNNLLQLSKVSANEQGVKLENVDFVDLIKKLKESYNFINPQNQIKLYIEAVSNSNQGMVLGNRNLLNTAIVNVLDNACKYSENDVVNVSLIERDIVFLVEIEDNGVGIPPEDLKKITEPFYRSKNSLNIKGSGIGLALCTKIIELHGGNIKFSSIVNQRTTVLIELPKVIF